MIRSYLNVRSVQGGQHDPLQKSGLSIDRQEHLSSRHGWAMRRNRIIVALLAAMVPGGCTQFPELDGTRSGAQAAPYPIILPLDDLLAAAAATGTDAEATLAARAAALRARAAALRGLP